MDKFTVTKRILANGRRWDELIAGSGGAGMEGYSLFNFGNIREAWEDLEKNFCKATVEQMVEAINCRNEDPEESIVYREVAENSIEARFFPKDCLEWLNNRLANGHTEMPMGITVTYEMVGDLDTPVQYQI